MRRIVGGIVLVVIALGVIGTLAGKPPPTPAATDVPQSGGTQPTQRPVVVTTPVPPAAKVTLIDLRGSGIKNSKAFTATDAWTLAYTYDCSGFGSQGNFIVTVEDHSGTPVDFPVNELGSKGASSSQVYSTGDLHLSINSECSWHVVASQP